MTRVSMWVARRPEDVLGDAIAAADRRKTMDALKIRHNVVVDSPAPSTAAGECRWCPTRHKLAALPDGASRLPRFGRLVASSTSRPCAKCIQTAMGTLKRRVDAGRPKNSGGAVRRTGRLSVASSAVTLRAAPPGHDPLGTCSTCRDYRRAFPTKTLTAGGIPQGCPPHAWNEKPRPPKWAR